MAGLYTGIGSIGTTTIPVAILLSQTPEQHILLLYVTDSYTLSSVGLAYLASSRTCVTHNRTGLYKYVDTSTLTAAPMSSAPQTMLQRMDDTGTWPEDDLRRA